MAIAKGDSIPEATLFRMGEGGPEKLSTTELFAGKTAVVFSVPGAFTPTCSAKHLPGFVEKADEIDAKGVDVIACLAVNDPFVMQAWGASAGADDKVEMLSDGNGEFAKALGLEFDASGAGLGTRSQRFAMIVKDGKVAELFVDAPGAFEVSSAEYVLKHL